MISRRLFTLGTLATPVVVLLARSVRADDLPKDELESSKLVYLTPIKSDGEESKCKAEIWFLYHEGDIFMVTDTNAWRAEAIRKDLKDARIWVGDYGNWQRANDKFRDAPEIMAEGAIEEDADVHEEILDAMGEKYSDEWPTWGPRFKKALEDGSRVMLRYTPKK